MGLPRMVPSFDFMSDLVGTSEFINWTPDGKTTWLEALSDPTVCTMYPQKWALILRPALPWENGAEWYIEDGSGRAICFLRTVFQDNLADTFVYVYIGKQPDKKSDWLKHNLGGHFSGQ